MTRNTARVAVKPVSRQAELRLRKQADKLRAKIYAIEETKRKRANQKLIGNCYKFRNSYGSGSEDWWLYARVMDLDETGQPIAITFQITSQQIYEIKTERWFSLHEGYQPISSKEFCNQWLDFLKAINQIRVIP